MDEATDYSKRIAAVAELRAETIALNRENETGPIVARALLAQPHTEWLRLAREEREHLTYGALDWLLEAANHETDRDAHRAYLLTTIVLRRHGVRAPSPMLGTLLRGRAWKEHGNALHARGRLRAALVAAGRAVAILSRNSVLAGERTAAQMLKAILLHEVGRTREATTLLRECSATFQRLGEEHRCLQVAIFEAAFLYDSGDYAAARSAFLAARATAERLNDQRELPRILNNLAECEEHLGNYDRAAVYLRGALDGFERQGMTAERQRVFWTLARMRRDRGQLNGAVAELLRVRRTLLARGMVLDAALAGLDLVELLAATNAGDEVRRVARELVEVFAAEGLNRKARMALAYLLEQTRAFGDAVPFEASAPFQADVRRVRTYLQSLSSTPDAEFSLPAAH